MFRWVLFVLAFTTTTRQAQAGTSEMLIYRHDQWPLSMVEFRDGKTGPACRYAYRYNWPQHVNDAYGLYEPDGAEVAQAAFTGAGPWWPMFGGAQITVTGPEGEPLGRITGHWSTLHRSRFTITDGADQPLAVAFAGYAGDEVIIVDAATQRKVLATLTYLEPWPSVERAFWTLLHHDTKTLPPELAHAFVAYVVDYRTWIAPYGLVGSFADWRAGKKSFLDLMFGLLGYSAPFSGPT